MRKNFFIHTVYKNEENEHLEYAVFPCQLSSIQYVLK